MMMMIIINMMMMSMIKTIFSNRGAVVCVRIDCRSCDFNFGYLKLIQVVDLLVLKRFLLLMNDRYLFKMRIVDLNEIQLVIIDNAMFE